MDIHFYTLAALNRFEKRLSMGRFLEKIPRLSFNYNLQKCFKIVSKISYTGQYNQIGKMVSILSDKS